MLTKEILCAYLVGFNKESYECDDNTYVFVTMDKSIAQAWVNKFNSRLSVLKKEKVNPYLKKWDGLNAFLKLPRHTQKHFFKIKDINEAFIEEIPFRGHAIELKEVDNG